uniref:Macroglobulin domain-containing protein n=1 Tax=Arion vulgaris TaxID=1028688 RepID=A0A0B7AXM8_9EUPU
MMMLNTAILILGSLLIAGASGGEYVITAPKIFQPGSNYQINVDILNKTNVLVVATIMEQVYNGLTGRYEFVPIQNGSGTFGVDNSGTISLPIRSDFKCQSCRVRIRGKGDLQFEQVTFPVVSEQIVVIIIQTDKAIYKPGQTVRYRVFAVYPDLLLYTGGISIDITDPNNNKIKVLKNATSPSGVVEDSFNLSDVLSYGTWTISVYLQNLTTTHSQGFEVSE